MPSQADAKRVTDRVLALSRGQETEVSLTTIDSALTRFANNEIHQNVTQRDAIVTVRVAARRRYGVATSNDLSESGLQAVVEQAAAIAATLPDSDDFLPLAEPADPVPARGFYVSTAEYGPLQRAASVRTICEKAGAAELLAAGAFRMAVSARTIANSTGLFVHNEGTQAQLMAVAMGGEASGFGSRLGMDVAEIDAEAIADEAIGRALRGRNPRAMPAGQYQVVLEPYATGDLLDWFGWTGFGGMAVEEGRSFMCGRLGKRLMGTNVSICDDPTNAGGLVRPFDYEGVPAQRVELIKAGIAVGPVHDRRTGKKAGAGSTGHAMPAGSTMGPMPINMFLATGEATTEELVRPVKRGLLVTRFWYTRAVHPLTVTITGMTRDGTFLIENGEVVGPVRNLRFTQSYLEAMGHVGEIGREAILVRDSYPVTRVPAIRIDEWAFTGATD